MGCASASPLESLVVTCCSFSRPVLDDCEDIDALRQGDFSAKAVLFLLFQGRSRVRCGAGSRFILGAVKNPGVQRPAT
jgi:hypothetical protein